MRVNTEHGMTSAKRRVLDLLKRRGSLSAGEIAAELALTDVAVRQHLAALEAAEMVVSAPLPPRGRGRPVSVWSLTNEAHSLFPDRHGELTVGLIDAIRRSLGEESLGRIVEVRARDQMNFYQSLMPAKSASLRQRVEALAAQRTREGYLAEVVQEKPGVYVLIEHHCPICDAAKACQGLCRAELEVFQRTLGNDVSVTRTKHLLAEDDRCAYRIERKRK